ncbi:MAG: transporter [Betaproteobacteria bacterium HGW-Betaproteobacteria-8]|nr:MAG: transporter [Betaproteobacteria bacterium HGW-Betaproteobacteria-8]
MARLLLIYQCIVTLEKDSMNQSKKVKHSLSTKLATGAITSIAALALSVVSLQVVAVGSEDTINQKPLSAEFKKLDINSDNQLTQDEVLKDKDVGESFALADINKDDILTADEYANFKSSVQQKRVAAYLDDATVTAKVKAELIKDAGLDGINISVETHKGQVILSGFVNTGEQLLRAVHIASGVSGVQAVKNALVIRG